MIVVLLLFGFSEVLVRVAIEQIKCHVPKNTLQIYMDFLKRQKILKKKVEKGQQKSTFSGDAERAYQIFFSSMDWRQSIPPFMLPHNPVGYV